MKSTINKDRSETCPNYEIIECPRCGWPNKITKGTCAHCGRCFAKIGNCDE